MTEIKMGTLYFFLLLFCLGCWFLVGYLVHLGWTLL